jgi:hypothetical protein
MMTQNEIAQYFKSKYGTRIHQVRICNLLKGKEVVSWPFAKDLSIEFPVRTVVQWKNAVPEELKQAFEQLKPNDVA